MPTTNQSEALGEIPEAPQIPDRYDHEDTDQEKDQDRRGAEKTDR